MTCPHCGRWAPADPETGYDADTLCPDCDDERLDCARDDYFDDLRNLMEDEHDGNPFE